MESNLDKKHPYRNRRRRSIVHDFFRVTSIHGLPAVARAETPRHRLCWSFIFLVFFIVMLYFVTISILAYFTYPTQTNVDISVEYPMTFPAVTVCNYAVLRYDLFLGPFTNYTMQLGLTSSNISIGSFLTSPNIVLSIEQFLIDVINRNESIDDYMFNLNELLFSCTYNGLSCNASDFIPFISSAYGLCYTFNVKTNNINDNTSIRTSADNGGQGLLQMEFFIYDYLTFPYLKDGIGIIAMLHDNTQVPQIDINGIGLAPGRQHTLQFSKKTTSFLPAPYTICTRNIRADMKAMFDTYYKGAQYEYSSQVCFNLCAQAYVYSICNCTSPTFWSERSVLLSNNEVIFAPICEVLDPCFQNAMNKFMNDVVLIDQQCSHCTSECQSTTYDIQLSSILAPGISKQLLLKEWVEFNSLKNSSRALNLPSDWFNNSNTYIRRNYVGLQVVLGTFLVNSYTQSATLTWADVISNVGGHTGLWIGVSMLSIVELLEMFYRIIRHFISQR